jgi:tetratricopeptide (TPR) repeat protein
MPPQITVQRDSQRKILLILGIIIICAFALRIINHLEMQANNPIYWYPIIDSKEYINNAEYIAETSWLGPSWPYFHPPFYTYFLAGFFWLFGTSITLIRIIQILLDCVNILLLFLLGRRIFNSSVALISCALYALYVPIIQFSVELLPPVLSVFLLLVSILALFKYSEHVHAPTNKIHWLCIAGICFGLLIITLPNFLVCLPIIVVFMFLFMRRIVLGRRIHYIILFCVLALLPAIASTVRNMTYTGEKIFISYNGGVNFYIGNNPDIYATVAIPPGVEWEKFTMIPYEKERVENFAQASRYWYREGFNYVAHHPFSWLLLTIKKTILFFNAHEFPRNFDLAFFAEYSRITKLPLIRLNVLLALGLCGVILIAIFWRTMEHRSKLLFLAAIFLSYSFSIVLFFIAARYRLPVIPLLAMVSAYTVYRIFHETNPLRLALFLVLACLFFGLVSIKPFTQDYPYEIPETKTYALIGATLIDQEHYQDAQGYLQTALERPPDEYTYDLHHQMGLIYSQQGNIEKSIFHYRSSLHYKPDNFAVWNDLASEYMTAGQLDSALVCYQRAGRLAPCCAKIYLNLVEVYFAAQQYDLIVPVLHSYFENCPSPHPVISYTLGKFYMQIHHDWDKAIYHIERAIQHPHGFELTADVFNNLGICYFYRNKPEDARQAWEKGLRLDPYNESIKNNLGKLKKLDNENQEP